MNKLEIKTALRENKQKKKSKTRNLNSNSEEPKLFKIH